MNSKLEERPQSEDNLQHLDDTSEESLQRSVRQRQSPTRYGIDEYADMAKEDVSSQCIQCMSDLRATKH